MEVFLILVVVIVAGCVGTMTGFGTSAIMVPVLLFLKYPGPETLLFVGIIHWFGNIWKLILFQARISMEADSVSCLNFGKQRANVADQY